MGRRIRHCRQRAAALEIRRVAPRCEQRFRDVRLGIHDVSNPAIAVNLDACIACNLCVRACREVQVNDVLGMADRGHHAVPVFDIHDPMGASRPA